MKAGGADYFGEDETLSKLRDHLGAYGVDGDVLDRQVRRLTSADASLDVDSLGALSSTGGLKFHVESDPIADDFVIVQSESVEPPPNVVASPAMDQESADAEPVESATKLLQLLDIQESEAVDVPKGFVISISMRGRCRRLHFECPGAFGCPANTTSCTRAMTRSVHRRTCSRTVARTVSRPGGSWRSGRRTSWRCRTAAMLPALRLRRALRRPRLPPRQILDLQGQLVCVRESL